MSRSYDFVQLDVFAKTPLAGNPLAVFSDGRNLSDQEMQSIAREMNLSETTFILPRDREIEATDGKRVRIFTVEEELPFAGHPTLGTALYLYSTAPVGADELFLALNVGKIGVEFTRGPGGRNDRVSGDVFGEMRQRDPEFGPTLSRDDVAAVLGTNGNEIASEWPSQIVSTGLPFGIVPIRDLKSLQDLKPDTAKASALLEGTGARFIFFVCPEERTQGQVRARMFFYGGEDPATGSAAGCAISWLVQHGLVKSDQKIVIHQGVEARRPSEMFVRATKASNKITNVRVGGYAAEVLRGTLTL